MSDHRRCAHLAAWGSAWLGGTAAFDDVLDAVTGPGRHVGGPGFEPAGVSPVGVALADWKRAGTTALRLALPVPGDVRGLLGSTEFRATALTAGQAVFGRDFGITVVPGPKTPSSAGREIVWHRDNTGELPISSGSARAEFGSVGLLRTSTPPEVISMADADHDLTEAIRETASLFARRGVTSWLADIAPALSNARRAGERLHLPASHPPRAVRMIAQAERLTAVLKVVDGDATAQLTSAAVTERAELLAPLRLAVRRALLAGYNAPAEVADKP